jgi:hypothetical protein
MYLWGIKMKFFTTLSLLFISIVQFAFTQKVDYNPFPNYGIWIVSKYGPFDPQSGGTGTSNAIYKNYFYEITSDTVIGIQSYKKVTLKSTNSSNNPEELSYGESAYAFAFRNDIAEKKVYIYIDIDGQEVDTLWYDFNLEIGDTLANTYSFTNSSDERGIVSQKPNQIFCDAMRYRYHFNCLNNITTLLDGVGFSDNFLQSTSTCELEPIYLYNTKFYCSSTNIETKPSKDFTIEIYPNPSQTILNIILNTDFKIINYTITDNQGRIMMLNTILDSNVINISHLDSGMYYIQIEDESKNRIKTTFIKI